MTTEQEQNHQDDDFSDAFAEDEASTDHQDGGSEQSEEVGEQEQQQDAGQQDQEQEQEQEQEQAADKTPAQADDENSQTWKQRYLSLQGKYNAEVAAARQKPAKQDTEVTTPDPDEHDEVEEAVKIMDEDHPTLSKGVEGKVRREIERMRQELAPALKVTQETMIERHFATIRKAHPDFDENNPDPDLEIWINEQPSFARDAYLRVMEGGNAQSVIEMLDAHKAARRKPTNTSRQQTNDDTVVRTRSRTVIPAGEPDKSDFSAGFNE